MPKEGGERKRGVGGLSRCLWITETHSHNFGSANQRLAFPDDIKLVARSALKPNKIKLCVVGAVVVSCARSSRLRERGKKKRRERERESECERVSAGEEGRGGEAEARRRDRWPGERRRERKSEVGRGDGGGVRRKRERERGREREGSNQS